MNYIFHNLALKTTPTILSRIVIQRAYTNKFPKGGGCIKDLIQTESISNFFQNQRAASSLKLVTSRHDHGHPRVLLFGTTTTVRYISTSAVMLKESISSADLKRAMDDLTEQFMEARELIDDARESMETVYFSEDMAEAQEAVKATLDQYRKLLEQLSEDQRQEVLRTIGLRMEELKAQEQAITDSLHDSH